LDLESEFDLESESDLELVPFPLLEPVDFDPVVLVVAPVVVVVLDLTVVPVDLEPAGPPER